MPKEKPIVDCAKHIDEFHVPHMEEFEHRNDTIVDMLGVSTPVTEPNPKPSSSDYTSQKYFPYHHPHH